MLYVLVFGCNAWCFLGMVIYIWPIGAILVVDASLRDRVLATDDFLMYLLYSKSPVASCWKIVDDMVKVK